MSRGYQRIVVYGTVGREPEVRTTQTNRKVCSFSVAVNEGKDQVTWFDCTAWEKTAEVAEQYVHKGDSVLVEGRMQTRKWESDGVTKTKMELIVTGLTLMGKKPERSEHDIDKKEYGKKLADGTRISDADLPNFDESTPF